MIKKIKDAIWYYRYLTKMNEASNYSGVVLKTLSEREIRYYTWRRFIS